MGFFNGVIKALGFDPNDRAIAKYEEKAAIIDSFEESVKKLTDEELAESSVVFKERLDMAKLWMTLCPKYLPESAKYRQEEWASATLKNSL